MTSKGDLGLNVKKIVVINEDYWMNYCEILNCSWTVWFCLWNIILENGNLHLMFWVLVFDLYQSFYVYVGRDKGNGRKYEDEGVA